MQVAAPPPRGPESHSIWFVAGRVWPASHSTASLEPLFSAPRRGWRWDLRKDGVWGWAPPEADQGLRFQRQQLIQRWSQEAPAEE